MTDDAKPITLTVEIDPTEFDEPRKLMFGRLVEEYDQETIAEFVGANLQQGPDGTGNGTGQRAVGQPRPDRSRAPGTSRCGVARPARRRR